MKQLTRPHPLLLIGVMPLPMAPPVPPLHLPPRLLRKTKVLSDQVFLPVIITVLPNIAVMVVMHHLQQRLAPRFQRPPVRRQPFLTPHQQTRMLPLQRRLPTWSGRGQPLPMGTTVIMTLLILVRVLVLLPRVLIGRPV